MFFIKQVEGIMSHLEPQVQVAFPNLALEDQLLPSMLEQEVTQRPALSENQCEEQRDLKSLHVFHKDLCNYQVAIILRNAISSFLCIS